MPIIYTDSTVDHDHARHFDQFYTCPKVAAECYDRLWDYLEPREYQFIEPSAGNGSFSRLLPIGSRAYDLYPRCEGIVKEDFFNVRLPYDDNVVVVGNPPFGKNSSAAINFFNHAARGAEIISFILPRTFQKHSIHKRLSRDFHLRREWLLPDWAFSFLGKPVSVSTVFQIWECSRYPRSVPDKPITHSDFEFALAAHADFAIQRCGAAAGRVHQDMMASTSSHYFIRAKAPHVKAIMSIIDFATTAKATAGNPSLAKTEIVELYEQQKRTFN